MENVIQILYQRVELMDESQTAIEALQRMLTRQNWIHLKKTLHQMKKHEQSIQSLENESLQLMQTKKDYSKLERKKFHKIVGYSIQKFIPHYKSHLSVLDGSHKHLCIMFINFYNFLQMPEKVIEIQTIYESKLYKTIPFLYLLAKWYIMTYRKLNSARFKQFDHQMRIYDDQLNKDPLNNQLTSRKSLKEIENPLNSSQIVQKSENEINEKKKKFRMFNKLIRQVMADAEYEEIAADLYTATIKYRSLLLRNLEIKNAIDEYLCSQYIQPEKLQHNCQSFNFSQHFMRQISNSVTTFPNQSSRSLRQIVKERAESVKLNENKRPKSRLLPQLSDASIDDTQFNSITFSKTIYSRKKLSGYVSKSPSPYFAEKSPDQKTESQNDLYTIYEKKSRTERERSERQTSSKSSINEKKTKKSEKIHRISLKSLVSEVQPSVKLKTKKIIVSIQ